MYKLYSQSHDGFVLIGEYETYEEATSNIPEGGYQLELWIVTGTCILESIVE